ncbi:hypothetical protein [Sphingobium sp.]|uniref:hypothetical protein n=1 Tax=Sphingobium sp. TaxID=1912891 RepID=UPI00257F2506|nr:hypothetical protein [Sphingobium sp.]
MAIPVAKPKALLADKGYDGDAVRENLLRDCQDFRVWPGIMGNKESHYVTTQRTCHTE